MLRVESVSILFRNDAEMAKSLRRNCMKVFIKLYHQHHSKCGAKIWEKVFYFNIMFRSKWRIMVLIVGRSFIECVCVFACELGA